MEAAPEQLHPARQAEALAGLVEFGHEVLLHPQRQDLVGAGGGGGTLAAGAGGDAALAGLADLPEEVPGIMPCSS